MKKGINIWAFPDGQPYDPAKGKGLVGCMQEAKDHGFASIEFGMAPEGELTPDTKARKLKQLRQAADDIGITIESIAAGMLWGCPLTADSATVRRRGERVVKRTVDAAAALGAGAILVIPGVVSADFIEGCGVVPYDTVYNRAMEAIGKLAPHAEKRKVVLGLENVWNKFLLSPLETRDFVDQINSPYVGVYFDVGNVILTGHPEQWIRILGSRICRVHCKDFRRNVGNLDGFVQLLEGDVDYPAVMSALRDTGYVGPMTAEHMPPSPGLLPKISVALDQILAM